MNDLTEHILLFVITGTIVVVISAMYAEVEDAAMFRSLPRRLAYFFGGCTLVALIMLVLEHTFASVS